MTARALLIDYGGVLTTSVMDSFERFAAREGLPPGAVPDLLRADPAARALLARMETGLLGEERFEREFAARLGVPAPGLIGRLMRAVRPDTRMLAAVRAARAHGVPTALVSNSWGTAMYPGGFRELFTGVVLSGEAGVRKPSRGIYLLGAAAAGRDPAECVFVDDLAVNLAPAEALGMTAIHHTDTAATVAALEKLFGLSLAGGPAPGEEP